MHICIWFDITNEPSGGGNQFLRALAQELAQLGHQIDFVPRSNVDIVLVNAFNAAPGKFLRPGRVAQVRQTGCLSRWARFSQPNWWLSLKRKGPTMVHRIDGVPRYYRGTISKADAIQPAINRLCDYTVFQSRYSMESFATVAPLPQHSEIIYNGVDSSLFRPPDRLRKPGKTLRFVASSWSSNPRKGFTTFAELSRIAGVSVDFVGRWPRNIDPAKVNILGPRTSTDVAAILQDADAMVHAAENEPCSNAIVEALASGLPILYRDSGGNRELAEKYGVELSNDLSTDVAALRERYSVLQDRVLTDQHNFSIIHVAKHYVSAFECALDWSLQ